MSEEPLAGVHPRLVKPVQQLLEAMRALGFPMRVTEGVRSDERQQELYAQGRTAPGAIVTNCDGVKHRSRHQSHADGFGYAVDCCFDSETPYEGPWTLYGAAGEALGLTWGGRFTKLVDRPHLELPTQEAD